MNFRECNLKFLVFWFVDYTNSEQINQCQNGKASYFQFPKLWMYIKYQQNF